MAGNGDVQAIINKLNGDNVDNHTWNDGDLKDLYGLLYPPQREYDVLIAPSDATDSAKSHADVILTGHADEVLINEAIAELSPFALIGIFAGTVWIATPITVPYGCALKGVNDNSLTSIMLDTPNTITGSMIVPIISDGAYELHMSNLGIYAQDKDYVFKAGGIPLNLTLNQDSVVMLQDVYLGGKMGGLYLNNAFELDAKNVYVNGHDKTNSGSVAINCIDVYRVDIESMMFNSSYIGYHETGVKFNSGCSHVRLMGVYFGTTKLVTPISNACVDFQMDNCWANVPLKVKGVTNIAQGATTAVITHGLPWTPTLSQINCVPDKNTNVFITSITSTQFTLNIPASVSGGVNIGWNVNLNR